MATTRTAEMFAELRREVGTMTDGDCREHLADTLDVLGQLTNDFTIALREIQSLAAKTNIGHGADFLRMVKHYA